MKARLLLFFFFVFTIKIWAHAGGFTERCDKISLPECTFVWNAITSTDSALYVVGNDGNCFIYYHEGGVKSVNTGTSDTLTGIQFINPSVGYIWGKNGTMLKTSNGGINWTNITTGVSDSIVKAQFIDENNAFFMAATTIYKTVNGGSSWTPLVLPGIASFKDFYFFDAQHGQIAGNIINPSIVGYLYQTTDGGNNWNQLYTDTIAFTKLNYSGNTGSLYGTTTNNPLLLESNNSGNTWSIKYSSIAWQLSSDIVQYNNQTVFVTTEQSGAFLYGCPYFLDTQFGTLYNAKNIYATTLHGVNMLYIIDASGLYKYTSGELICRQFNFANGITPNASNPYNIFARGKKVRFKVLVSNASHDTIIRIVGKLQCKSPFVTVTDSVAVHNNVLGNLSMNNNSWSADEYEIEFNENTPDNYIAHFEFTYDNSIPSGHTYKSTFSMPLLFSPFSLINNSVIDTATENTQGNGNGVIEPYETAQMKPSIKNTSPHYLYDVSGTLYCDYSPIYIWNNYARPDGGGAVYNSYSLGSFNPNQTVQPVGDYVFTDSFSVDYIIPFTVVLKGTISTYIDPLGCSYSYFYNVNYNWGLRFDVNTGFDLPPDSLRKTPMPVSPIIPSGSVGISEFLNEQKMLSIFPNPTINGVFTLSNSKGTESFQLLNVLGQPVKYEVQKQENGNTRFDISGNPNGVYFLKINTESTFKTIKLIKN